MNINALRYINQSTDDLVYLFAVNPVNVENNFKIIRRKKYVFASGKLELSIIGESHAVRFRNKDINLTEILACVKNKYLYQISQKSIPIKDSKKNVIYKYKNIFFDYNCFIKKIKISPMAANKILANFKSNSGENKLFFEWNDKQSSSFTFMEYKVCRRNYLRISTAHFYRDDSSLVSTSSSIKLKQQSK